MSRQFSLLVLMITMCTTLTRPVRAQFLVDACKSTVVANAGVVLACPKGDGDYLTNAIGGTNCQITLTVRDHANRVIAGVPATDMWLAGCTDNLLLCGGSSGSSADHDTDAAGMTTFSHPLLAGGCSTGVWVVALGAVIENPVNCTPLCVPVQVRSVDYKSANSPCPGDQACPDAQVTLSDWSWFTTHYPTAANPGASYLACADFAAPLGSIALPELSKFSIHYLAGHKCLQ